MSECLAGAAVRWDGDHNGDCWPRRTVAKLFTLVGLCPEAGIGLGVPREPIRLIGEAGQPQAVAVADYRLDHTAALARYARTVAPVLDGVDGYVFADRSPSCGLAGVKVYRVDGSYRRRGRGVYAAAVVAARPSLPAVDAETLNDEAVLLDFAVAVICRTTSCRDEAGIRKAVAPLLHDPGLD